MASRQVAGRPSGQFRPDVAGLRAVAVVLVLLYHAGVGLLPAGFVGVDVFFVISGFLITGLLLAEVERTGRVSLAGFYARRAKRILPAATVVLAATAAGVWLLVPRTEWRTDGGDIVSAATYVVNWRLAGRAVDYLAQGNSPSPVQHYWSLAVEEQFYLLWPLLMIVVLVVAKKLAARSRGALWVGLALIALPSFVWSVYATTASSERAFFLSTTRLWELAIGAAVALVGVGAGSIARPLALALGWSGLAAVIGSAAVYSTHTAWPGVAAAVPTLGTAAVILAGAAAGAGGPVALLRLRPFQWVGDLSYSLYLWHWPMLVLAAARWGELSVREGLAVVVLSAVPAWVTFQLVENPLRYARAVSSSPRLALSLGASFTLVGVCAGLSLLALSSSAPTVSAATARSAPGAAVLLGGGMARDMPVREHFPFITPDPLDASTDRPVTSTDGCFQQMVEPDLIWCEYGKPDGKTRVALVGDSKADQWLPAFQMIAEQNDWKLMVAFKAACPFTTATTLTGDDPENPYPDCTEWNARLLDRLVRERPDYVFTSQGAATASDGKGGASVDTMVAGMREAWAALQDAGSKVVVIANNPGAFFEIPSCVEQHRRHLSACAYDRAFHDRDASYLTQRAAVAGTDVPMIDMFDIICPTTSCPPVIGNVLVYSRGSHLSTTYVRTMTPQVAQAMASTGIDVQYSTDASDG